MEPDRGPVARDHREPGAIGPDLLLALDRSSRRPLHEQLETALRETVRSGRLPPDSKVPSSRALAGALGVSRGVVLEAYSQLLAEGYLVASQGAPTRVSAMPSIERPPVPSGSLEPVYAQRFDPGLPDLAAFPRDRWTSSLRSATRTAPFAALGHGDPRGAPELRNELMSYLGRVRGAAPEPEHTLVCSGAMQGFAALCRVLAERGIERIAVERPGWNRTRVIAEAAGLEPVPIPVDEHGLVVEELASSDCEVVIVTPAHQFPTGVVMASERRSELLEWAEDEDALIVEDDYDSELRYDRVAVGALQGLAPERVLHLGSASKRLAPGVRVGWMLAPSWLSGALTYEQGLGEVAPPALDQLALAEFLARGELDRHLRRMRLRYRERRSALVSAVAAALPGASVLGAAAGLFTTVLLPAGVDEDALVRAAATRGVGVEGVSADAGAGEGRPGLVLGFGNLGEAEIERGVRTLGELYALTGI
ncbi:MAG TPA: PLP-dependent aminotransferase family protein [Solirubrobacteraceae bacterium]